MYESYYYIGHNFDFGFKNYKGFTKAKKPWLPVNPNYY